MKDNQTIRVPIRATYEVINGKAEQVDAKYADVPVMEIAALLLRGFGVDATLPADGVD